MRRVLARVDAEGEGAEAMEEGELESELEQLEAECATATTAAGHAIGAAWGRWVDESLRGNVSAAFHYVRGKALWGKVDWQRRGNELGNSPSEELARLAGDWGRLWVGDAEPRCSNA